ncbi:DUF6233 domain-containing protein [Streptomyces sp. NPDC021356]|uniref:DUF6233 domain-containing protein n=1 Tax=Streptomyces sp. NPDC021356 TaxID=3154900 RepID=UPI00340BB7C8
MTPPPGPAAPGPVPVRVVLPPDPVLGHPEQEIVARLWRRRQTENGWVFQVGLPSYEGSEDGALRAAEYRVWVRAPEHVRPVDGVDYDQIPTDRLEAPAPPSAVREILGERRPSGWVVQKVRIRRGPGRRVLHAPDCTEAPQDAPVLDLERALDVAENPATTLCTLCGAAQEITPVLRGFDHTGDETDPPGA